MPKKGDHKAVFKELAPVASKWYSIGLALNTTQASLDRINKRKRSDKDKLQSVIEEWLSGQPLQPSWRALVNALRSQEVGEGKLALQLELKFCPGTDTGSEPREAGGTCTRKDVYTCTCNSYASKKFTV